MYKIVICINCNISELITDANQVELFNSRVYLLTTKKSIITYLYYSSLATSKHQLTEVHVNWTPKKYTYAVFDSCVTDRLLDEGITSRFDNRRIKDYCGLEQLRTEKLIIQADGLDVDCKKCHSVIIKNSTDLNFNAEYVKNLTCFSSNQTNATCKNIVSLQVLKCDMVIKAESIRDLYISKTDNAYIICMNPVEYYSNNLSNMSKLLESDIYYQEYMQSTSTLSTHHSSQPNQHNQHKGHFKYKVCIIDKIEELPYARPKNTECYLPTPFLQNNIVSYKFLPKEHGIIDILKSANSKFDDNIVNTIFEFANIR